ncbi:MAG: aminotransferase class V-fold PLP-dependent enzyme [Treponema sp.]|jgi:cysteine desulfurase|nr:aminotransferase class V-fold PLP-dependent enzyme [Treponema sp.]
MKRRYFDWAATAPPDFAFSGHPFGNPSSLHEEGREAKKFLEAARSRCAAVLGVRNEELSFTSGGTEANAIACFSLLAKPRRKDGADKGAALLYSAAEHPSVRENCAVLGRLGIASAAAGVDSGGAVSEASLSAALKKNPAPRMAFFMAVNNETGAAADLASLTALLRSRVQSPVHVHCDMVQAAGKIPFDIAAAGIDSAAISAHKLGGPRGTGLLYARKKFDTLIRGGGQEGGVRPGTENVFGAAAMAAALEKHAAPGALESARRGAELRMEALVAGLRKRLDKRFFTIPAYRAPADRRFSPWILQCRLEGIPGEVMVRCLDEAGFAVSTGSACSAAEKKRPVLEAMGVDARSRLEGIRISQGWSTTSEDVEALVRAIAGICEKLPRV